MAATFQRPATVATALMQRAAVQSDRLALRFLNASAGAEVLTYRQLDHRARCIAAMLERFGNGTRVVLLLPSGPDYVAAFFGCLYAGIIAVPAYPPESTRTQHLQRLLSIIADAQPSAILTSRALARALPDNFGKGEKFPDVLAIEDAAEVLEESSQYPSDPSSIAFLQYTSGSTSAPKGVEVTHANLEANEWLIRQGYGIGDDDVIVSWLPLYHDMGLIGGLLQGIYSGVPVVLMAPQYFLERPVRWLEAISEHGGTISGGPDFAYRLCHERIGEEKLPALNLSRWRVAFSGAEPIRQDSLALFAEKFASCGFRADAFLASYGLAEATLYVTGGSPGEGIAALQVDAEALASNCIKAGHDLTLMSCGRAQPEHPWRIVDAQTGAVLGDDCVGEICASGPSIAQGYWRRSDTTAATFIERDGRRWLCTGDLGFRHNDELFVTGRIKDMLIIRGHNLYPQDVERTVEEGVDAVRKGRVAAFPIQYQGREALAVAAEVGRKGGDPQTLDALIARIRHVVAEAHQEPPAAVILLRPGALPKTSSGKLQRSACRAQLEAGTLDTVAIYRQDQPAAASVMATSRSAAEQVAALWREILKVDAVTPTESFFALGGNSVLAIQLVAELRERLQIPLDVRTLFEAQTLSAFTAIIESLLAQQSGVERLPRVARDQALPQSPAQNRLWFLWQMAPTSVAYNIPGGLRLRGELSKTALQASFDALIARHESLRTTFYEEVGRGFQTIHAAGVCNLLQDDLSNHSSDEKEARAQAIRVEEARTPFDLQRGPLLRIRLIALDDQDHILLVTLHHIVADGWSLGILLNELAQFYSAQMQQQSPAFDELPIQYADYAMWCHRTANSDVEERQLAYWRAELGEPGEPLALPLDHPLRGQSAGPAERFSVRLEKTLSARLLAVARERDVSMFMLLLAAFQALLHRCTGQSDIRIGVPHANRRHFETQKLVGFFINTQVLRAAVDSRQRFDELLEAARDAVLRAQANADVDFERVVAAVSSEADISLFAVMFNHQQRDPGALRRLPGLLAEELPWHSHGAKFPLQLQSEEDHQGAIRIAFDYAADLFERLTIEALMERYLRILEQVCAQPTRAIGDLDMMAEEERQQLRAWGECRIDYPGQLLPELFTAQAGSWPQAIALRAIAGDLTYALLDQRANALAHHLRQSGVGPDVCVGIAMERSSDLIVALLAIVKASGAYVPLDLGYPRERLNLMICDSGISLLVGRAAQLGELAIAETVQIVDIDQLDLQAVSDTAPPLDLHRDNLAYVIFTSGSTGRPKGVCITHGALADRLQWMRAQYALGSDDVVLAKAPLSFDVSVWECFLPLISGSRLVLAGEGEQRDPRRLVELVQAYGITLLHFVPPMLQLFIEEAGVERCHSLRHLFSGGEVLPAELCRRVQQRLPDVALHNRYGPTETAINVTHWPCISGADVDASSRVPIGTPLANTVCELREHNLALAPVGIHAELLLGGSGVARGYIGRPALTAERFIPAEQGERFYRSGDRARWRHDGVLEYLGRCDEQIKLRGFRIEPEEIRHQLLQQAGVQDAAISVQTGDGGTQLVAYVCRQSDSDASCEIKDSEFAEHLRCALKYTLPDYMVPAQIVVMEVLPLTPSGKLDRNALPVPSRQSRHYVAPRNADEQRLAAIWCDVLGCERVGLGDDFFALGGHSLLATRIVSRTRQAFDIELPLRSLFECSRFADFAQRVAEARNEGQRSSYGDIAVVDRSQRIPLSYSQQRMWFLWQLDPQSPAYNVGGAAVMRGPLDADCFERALQALILRHETLRTVFPSDQGKPFQQVMPDAEVSLQRVNFSSLSGASLQERLQAIADEQAHQPFDLERGPLLRVTLVKIGEREHRLLVALHHIVTEGWAMDIFARELAALYGTFLDGCESPLEPLRVQYVDYSVWQRQWLESGEMQRQLAYWLRQLGGDQPVLELPTDRPRPAEQSYRGDLYRFDLDTALSARVRAFNAERGLTLFMTMTAALALLLYRYSGQNDLRIGAPVANRIRPESEGLIGAFLNTQVLRIQPQGQMTGDELLEQVRQTVIEGQSHQDLPFDQLVDALQPQRSAAYNPLFQVMCNVQRWEFQQSRQIANDLHIEYLVNDARATKFDLNLEVTDIDAQLRCCFTYSCDLFDRDTIGRMARHWQNVLHSLLDNPAGHLSELTLLDADEYRALTTPGSGERLPQENTNTASTIQGLFEQQVELAPTAPALTRGGESISYAELNARANRLARRLRELGVGPEQYVGLALPRSIDMVVGLLAILKAGGAYMPLDPEYPRDRLRYLIEDSGIALLLTHATLIQELAPLPENVSPLDLQREQEIVAAYSADNLPAVNTPEHTAYLIYTSGSTGKPKGVAVAHGPLAMHCQATGALFGMRPDDCELHFYSINFDAASERLWVPLLFGARVVLREQGQWDAEVICNLIRDQKVTVLGFTPSYGRQLAQHLNVRDTQLPVRLCITGGEVLTPEHVCEIRGAFGSEVFFNAYGPTETVVMPLAYRLPALQEAASSVAIGRVVGRRDIYVLNADLALVPPGACGELFVGGHGIARGYHKRPGLSAERFVANPFDVNGGRLYRTGDWVRQRRDGALVYQGRLDQQVKIRGFRIELGEIEARMQAHAAVRECVVIAVDGPSNQQLIAYIVPAHSSALRVGAAESITLREQLQVHLRAELPDHMVPAHLILLPHLPLTANGKLDRSALSAPDWQSVSAEHQVPRNQTEMQLAEIWCDVLNAQQVGIDDNFFELGGDSILSIQVVSRARQTGLHFTAKDLFRHQTIRTLAAIARSNQAPGTEQQALVGSSLMTPIQHWFFELGAERMQHWNQSLLFKAIRPLHAEHLRQALQVLVEHHDALRQRFIGRDDGAWSAEYRPTETDPELLWVRHAQDGGEYDALCNAAQCSLDLGRGPLLRAVLFEGEPQRLLIVIHHLVVDGVSWRLLLDDLQRLYLRLERREAVSLPAKSTSVRQWAERLHVYAGSAAMRDELSWWQAQLADAPSSIPCDRPQGSRLECHAQRLTLRLNLKQTKWLLGRATQAYRNSVAELLLVALTRTLCRWSGDTSALIEVEGHGREEALFQDIDLSRSVGWFTSTYPVRLIPQDTLHQSIKAIKEQLRAVPYHGVGYGVLRYLGDEAARAALRALPQARVTFNYLGQLDRAQSDDALFQLLNEPQGRRHDNDTPLPNWLSIDSEVIDDQLLMHWTFSDDIHDRKTILDLAENFRRELKAVISHCLRHERVDVTPSDFPLAQLTQDQLDALPISAGAIEDIYPLTPMQEGLLLHTLLEPGTGIYFMQDRYRIDSDVNTTRFDRAWRAVIARHEALRASFCWSVGDKMLQIIHREVDEGVLLLDWSKLPEEEHEQRLQVLLKEEREAGFDLLTRPPFRLRLIRLARNRHWFIMSNHHILIDAWCRSLLMGDFLEIYDALKTGREPELDTPPRYREFITWLAGQGQVSSRLWWQQQLAGFEQPSFIPSDRPVLHDKNGMQVADRYAYLSEQDGRRLRDLAQRQQLTVNTFAQAAWALVLLRYGGERDVVFGVTVAGRPASLPDMQRTVGLFINTVPLRVPMPAMGVRQTVKQWLHTLLDLNLELREHEHVPLVAIQDGSELAKGQPLFDSLFVFENAPVEHSVLDRARGLKASSDSGRTHTNYPLTVVCYPGDELGLHLSYDQRFFDETTVDRLLMDFKRLLLALIAHFDGDFADLPVLEQRERQFLLEDCNRTERAYPLDQGYIPLFAARVAEHPQRIVARCLGEAWSYAELDRRSNRLGQRLIAAGVQPDQPVALLAERGLPLLGMIAGSFKAGAGYVPLDPVHPLHRLTHIVQVSAARVVVCTESYRQIVEQILASWPRKGRPLLLVWEDVQDGSGDEQAPQIAVTAQHLAYIIYTSGSTGLPKGVAVEQGGMLNNQLSKVPYLQLSEHDVIAQTASQSFDISVWQFLTAPLCGARLEIVPDAISQDPAALLQHVRVTGISILESVPSLIQGLLDEDTSELGNLRCLLPTGEAMPPALARQWLQRYPDVEVINAYGPAECSDDVALFSIDEASTECSCLPIGTPTDNNRLYLLDGDLQPVAPGAIGELYVAGVGVGRGYVGDAVRTAQSFLPCPFARVGESGMRLYRSGDLARRRIDGVLEYVGRTDHQVKIRGFRIELGEIESRLRALPEVREAVVAVQHAESGKHLVGYVVPTDAALLATDEDGPAQAWVSQSEYRSALQQHLRIQLPEYMVPVHWLLLERLPLTANGKLDRKALPLIQFDQVQNNFKAPRTELEHTLSEIWRDVLKVRRVGINDDFFALGGHSLLATQIASRLQKQLQRAVPLRAMFECNTVAELAVYIESLEGSALNAQKARRIDDLMSRLEAL